MTSELSVVANGRTEFYRWLRHKLIAASLLIGAVLAFLFGLFINAWSAGTVFEYFLIAIFFLLGLISFGFGARLWRRAQWPRD